MRRAQGPRQREDALSRSLRGFGRAVVPRAASLRDARPVAFCARRGGAGLRFPPPGFSPRRPPFEGAPFRVRIIGLGQTHPRSLAALVHWGQPHGGHFRLLCRRPSAFAKAMADTVGSPAEISPPLVEHPHPPAVLRGPVARYSKRGTAFMRPLRPQTRSLPGL